MRRTGLVLVTVALGLLGCSASGDDPGTVDAGAQDDATQDPTDDDDAGVVDDDADGSNPSTDDEGADQGSEEQDEPEPEPLEPLQGLALEVVADGLTEPVDVAVLPGSDRLLVVERRGTVQAVDEGGVADEPVLDLTGEVNANSIEQGLLGLVAHPDFPDDPRLFVFHSLADNDNVLVSYEADADGAADPASRQVLLTVDKEPDKVRHNGGRLLFGPHGHLHVSLGDAARASVNGQDPTTLPGSILRLDVDGGEPYDIPADNPFADGVEGAPEVWWYGLRNPWRFSFDEPTGLAYIADVGQEDREEVNVVPADEGGLNFGWPIREGTIPFYGGEAETELTDPVLEVRHDDADQGCSISGGHVYRGTAIPEYDGHYFYADWCRGWVRSFVYEDGEVSDEQDHSEALGTEMVAGFGVDDDGELLVVDSGAGVLARLVAER